MIVKIHGRDTKVDLNGAYLSKETSVDLYHHSAPPFTNWVIANGSLREDFVVVDIGCQGGPHPRWTFLGDRLKFYGFDAISEVIEELRATCPSNHTYFSLALGEDDGEKDFFIHRDSFSSSFFAAGDSGRRTVSVRRADSLFADGLLPCADYIKLDCEGFEPYILRGAREYLAASNPVCVTSETNFNVSPIFPSSHFHAVYEELLRHDLLVFDVNMVRAPRPSYAAARQEQPWPEPDLVSGVPHLHVGGPTTLDVVFCRDLVAEMSVRQETRLARVDQVIKAMITFELHGLMDCAFDLAVHYREQLQRRFDVNVATQLLLLPPPHARNTADVVNGLKLIERLRTRLAGSSGTEPCAIASQMIAPQGRASSTDSNAALTGGERSRSWQLAAPFRRAAKWLAG